MTYFFKTTAELKNHVAVSQALSVETLRPYLANGLASDEILGILGADLYTELLDAYDAANMDAAQTKLLEMVQSAIAPLAVYAYLKEAAVRISDAGVTTDREKTAFQWQQEKLESSQLQLAYRRLDALILFLQTNEADYSGWSATDEFKATLELLIPNAKEFSVYINIRESSRTFRTLKPFIRDVEMTRIAPLLSPALYSELKTQLETNSFSGDNAELMVLIRPAIAYLAVSSALDESSIELTPEGAYVTSVQATGNANIRDSKPASLDQAAKAKERYRQRGEAYLESLRQFLNSTATSSRYASFFSSSNYRSPETGQSYKQNPERNSFLAL